MCEDCHAFPNYDSYYPGSSPFINLKYTNPYLSWQDLYMAQAFASKDKSNKNDVQIDYDDSGNFEIESNRRLSRRQQMEISQDFFNQFNNSDTRTPKKKAKRQSNNDPYQILPSGIIKVSRNDPFDQGGIDPGQLVPALRNQRPTFDLMRTNPNQQTNQPFEPTQMWNINPLRLFQ